MSQEHRHFAPSAEFAKNAIAQPAIYEEAKADRLGFWSKQAKRLHWHKPFTQVLDWSEAPFARWFHDGELNISYNCLDRHVVAGNGDRVAIHFEGEPGDTRTITYAQLTDEVKSGEKLMQSALSAERSAGLIGEVDYFNQRKTLSDNALIDQQAAIELEIESIKRSGIAQKDKASQIAALNNQIAGLERERVAITQQAEIDIAAMLYPPWDA